MSMAPAGQLIGDWSDVPAGQLRAGTSFGPVVLPPPHPPTEITQFSLYFTQFAHWLYQVFSHIPTFPL